MQPYLWQFFAMAFAGWVNRFQQDAIEYLKEENRVLWEQPRGRRLRFTDAQRRRLAAKARTLGSAYSGHRDHLFLSKPITDSWEADRSTKR